ncbi:MAG TPA: BTAD domain-containing putative transcriptional regulator [Actinomycetota bacterium]|jgi:predicted ATPase|nr:BTAD domain-containing putative transcriptional regulator [Actinomycetota bacterium]
MRVGILGPLEVVADGDTVEVGGARLRTLLIRLALDAGRVVPVESLADALWPDDGPTDPANALQSLVSRLRRALPGKPALRSAPGGYCLDVAPEAVDALRFERLALQGRRALRSGEPGTAARLLREALGLWRGEALADVAEAPFGAAAAVRLSELRLTATEDRVEAELAAAPEHSRLVAELEELAVLHPLRERLRVLLVRALQADGRPAEALSAYEKFRGLLADELGADPGPELRQAHLAVLRGETGAERPRGRRSRGNLRAALTSFVGRAEEQTRIGRQLTDGRLVTLVGPGGAGKTRLATTLAAGISGDVPGGVWLVELAPLTEPGEVPQAVIGALGLREAGPLDAPAMPRDAVSRLVEALAATETLIVLDNCEHLIDAAARLVDDLLGRCPRLRVLATSREPLGVPGETLCLVLPLGLPEPGASADEAMACPAVRLFADRVAAVRPDFAVTDGNVAAVAEICRRLDGLPLAIELAAARLRSLPLEELAARLSERFRLLTGGSRTALPRHRTLRAVVAWSWDLLDDDERRLARRLAVFPATITPESAAQVCAPAATDLDALDALAALADKSLLQVVEGPEPRYRMLETIREYGLELLAETGEIAQVRAAHAGYFLGLAERAEPRLRGAGQVPWTARLVAERDNLLAALHFARDTGDAETAVRLGAALGLFWTVQGNHAEAASRLRLALEVPGRAPEQVRAVATAFYLFNTVLAGGSARAQVALEETRALARVQGRVPGDPAAALIEPALALVVDDTAWGRAATDRRLSHPDPWARAMLRLTRALLDANDGDMDGMRQDLTAAVEAFREAGERWGLATSLTYLALARLILGDFDGAIAALEESVRLLRQLDPDDDAILQRVWIADARRQQGDVERARAELLEMVAPGTGTSSARHLILARVTLGNLARYDGDLEEAARQYGAAWEGLGSAPFSAPELRPMLQTAMAHLAVATDELGAAERHLCGALAVAVEMPDMPMAAVVGVGVARLRLRGGAAPSAAQVLGAAHALRGAPDAFNPDVVRLAEDLRGALGERAYRAAYAVGRGLDRTAALALIEAQVRRR